VIAMEGARLLAGSGRRFRPQLLRTAAGNQRLAGKSRAGVRCHPARRTICVAAYGDLQLYDGEHLRSVAQRGLSSRSRIDCGRDTRTLTPRRTALRRSFLISSMQPLSTPWCSAARSGSMASALCSCPAGRVTAGDDHVSAQGYVRSPRRNCAAGELRRGRDCDENARLLTEQQEALERQTATASAGVINASPGNLTPVFDTMLERRCGCAGGLARSIHLTASASIPLHSAACLRRAAFQSGEPATADAGWRPCHPA
jgi:hypothetical protein